MATLRMRTAITLQRVMEQYDKQIVKFYKSIFTETVLLPILLLS